MTSKNRLQKRSRVRKAAAVSPQALAARFVKHLITSNDRRHRNLMDLDSYDWSDPKLLAAIQAALPTHTTEHIDQCEARAARLQCALQTNELRRVLWEMREGHDQLAMLQREAAFLFGVELGKRLAERAR